jgi:hypothetical protein
MSPPTQFALCACTSAGLVTVRARTHLVKPGAKRSICASIRAAMSFVEPFGTWQ